MEEIEPVYIDKIEESSDLSKGICEEFIFVDMLGFYNRDHFICKEFSLIDGDYEYHTIIKPPYSIYKIPFHDREMIEYEYNHLHGLKYEDGEVHLLDVIQATYERLMTKKS